MKSKYIKVHRGTLEKEEGYNKSEKLGIFIYYTLLASYTTFFVWLILISNYGLKEILDLITPLFSKDFSGTLSYIIYIFSIPFGLLAFSILFQAIIEEIFYPDTKEEKEYKDKIKQIKDTYGRHRAHYLCKREKLLFKLKKLDIKYKQ